MSKPQTTSQQKLIDALPDFTVVVDRETLVITQAGTFGAAELGYEVKDLVCNNFIDFLDYEVHPQETSEANGATPDNTPGFYDVARQRRQVLSLEELTDRLRNDEFIYFDHRFRDADGVYREYSFVGRDCSAGINPEDSCCAFDGPKFVISGRDYRQVIHDESRLHDLLKLADMTDDILLCTDRVGSIRYHNKVVSRIYRQDHVVGTNFLGWMVSDDEGSQRFIERVFAAETRIDQRISAFDGGGGKRNLSVRAHYDEELKRWYAVLRDVGEEINKEAELQRLNRELSRLNAELQVVNANLARRATTDSLTGVGNRSAFVDRVDLAIIEGQTFSVLMLDMDDFKTVNDSFDHAVGDAFLQEIARRLRDSVPASAMVARLGGDEFVAVLMTDSDAELSRIANGLIESVRKPITVGSHTIERSCSIGVATHLSGEGSSEVLRRADRALYKAKEMGRNRSWLAPRVSGGF